LREAAPVIYQVREGEQVLVDGAFELVGSTVGFSIGAWDSSLPLIIDPLVYVTLLGGSGTDAAMAAAVDRNGATYITGFTTSVDLPTTNAAQSGSGGGNEVFVAKLNPAGNALVYCTFIGARSDDRGLGIAVDGAGAAYVTGFTTSSNFPTRAPLQATPGGGKDAFVLKLNAAGNALVYSTYLGGSGMDSGNGIAVDAAGNAYVTGDTASSNFPVNRLQQTLRGGTDGFISKVAADGSRLVYSTYLGGASEEHAAAIAVDSTGAAIVTGSTYSADYPVSNAYQSSLRGGQDVVISKVAASGDSFLFSTYLGGSGGILGASEEGLGIAVDSQDAIYIAGETSSADFPVRNAGQSANAGWQDAFAAKFTSSGGLIYCTYMGGANLDRAVAIAVDSTGAAYVGGQSTSATLMSFPAVQNATGAFDGFVVKLAPAGNAVGWILVIGGVGQDAVTAVATDPAANVYVAGYTLSPSLPGVNGAQLVNVGNYGMFVLKIGSVLPVSITLAPPSVTLYASQKQQFTATVSNTANTAVTWSLSPNVGTISGGLYTAPAVVASAQTVVVTATSAADPTKTASATVTVAPLVSSGINLAQGGVAAQSSTYMPASNAIDGNTDGDFLHGSVTHTAGLVPYPWWEVDLGSSAAINTVVIWNRTDCCMDRLGDYWVFVSDTPFAAYDTPSSLATRPGVWSVHRLSAPDPVSAIGVTAQGRYVRVQLAGTDPLQLAEVQVFGAPVGTNLAAGKTAAQSSTYTSASNAVDGNTNGDFSRGSVSHTWGAETYPWWQVDLGSSAAINTVVIWNRTDCCQERLTDYWIFVSDTPFVASDTPLSLSSRAATWSAHRTSAPIPFSVIAVPARGRYVRVQLSRSNYLHLAEVQVFGSMIGANLAAGRIAAQSSTYAPASRAVDGNTDGDFFHASVTHTWGAETNPWWEVDLGSSTAINSIVIWNRTDCCKERLADYWIFVSDTPFTASDTPTSLRTRAGTWSVHRTSQPDPASAIGVSAQGRYVRVQLNASDYLQLAEVQVFR
jgi:hypothetical protein